MYQSCNRRLIPSMASSTLLSPATTTKPCFLHCKSASDSGLHPRSTLDWQSQDSTFSTSRSSSERGGNYFKVGFIASPRDCTDTCNCARCRKDSGFCCRDGARRASFCVGVCAGSASSLLSPVGGYLKARTVSASPACSLIGSRGDQFKVRALSTSVASSSLKKEETASSPAIVQPSVTWGIIPHPPESSRKVLDFLESEGIDTTELHDVELPTSVEVMQERLDFLKKLGLSLEAINNYPLMVTCSIKKNLVPVLDYLEQLGLRSRDLPAFLEKYPVVLHSSVVIDLMPVVEYLLGLDIQRKDISRVIARFPDVLGYRLEGTMSTSVAYLVSLGVRMRCIGRMLTEYPEILGMRVGNNIKPKVDFLVSYGIPKAVVAKILEVRPYILGFDFSETMQVAVNDLLEAGVRKEAIAGIITQYPDILGQNIKENLTQKTNWLVQQVKVEPSNVPSIIEKLPQVLFIKEGLAMERVRYFMSAGCSADDVAKMVSDCPQIMALSISQVIEPSLNFLLHDMKRSVKEVVKFPMYFTYDLKSRIMPRYKLIAEKGVKCSLEWFLNCTDQRFKVRLSADYLDDDEEPGHVFQMGGVVFTETKQVAEVASIKEDLVSGLNQQSRQQVAKKEQPRLSHGRVRQAVELQHQRSDNEFGTASDSDFEGVFVDEDELDMTESLSEFDDDEDELDMSESPSEFDDDDDDETDV
eukprot:c17231_g1_i1 orf=99-2192(+)